VQILGHLPGTVGDDPIGLSWARRPHRQATPTHQSIVYVRVADQDDEAIGMNGQRSGAGPRNTSALECQSCHWLPLGTVAMLEDRFGSMRHIVQLVKPRHAGVSVRSVGSSPP
jgi:hypothetical protein